MKLLCILGFHKYKEILGFPRNMYRGCIRCKKKQKLEFYSNRTQEWVDYVLSEDEI
jgi:hypothetical protein